MTLKSVLRYPGGKSKAIKQILQFIPLKFDEYREPFVGGGSLYLSLKQSMFNIHKFWINDINADLMLFWKYAQTENSSLVNHINSFLSTYQDGKQLFTFLRDKSNSFIDIEKAARFFILNRITFSGTTEAGGFSQQAFLKRLTKSSIQRIVEAERVLQNTHITNLDYSKSLEKGGNNVFIFLDPPYYSTIKSRLYGKNGCNHIFFDFEKFANDMKNCNHKWLITLDDNDYIRDLFSYAKITPWSLQYGMNNVGSNASEKGKELFIYNYEVNNKTQLTISDIV
ncbi:MAG TPA: DNA adenine methylase [Candidatus Cloacimonadota bacterium]|nr:DNA adenine methylase [Candidatus Cloacimonadota bacterium]HOQ79753.1 DNA adenine methylase [Candidatus Cloacimonadota bacterium]